MSTSDTAIEYYRPIDCSLYDHLEVFAMRGKEVSIIYNDEGRELKIENVVIKTTITQDGQEFLRLESGLEIRLDRLVLVDDVVFKQSIQNSK